MKNLNWKYLVFDMIKLALPIIIANLLPDAPQAEILQVVLYILSAILGVDSSQKIVRAIRS